MLWCSLSEPRESRQEGQGVQPVESAGIGVEAPPHQDRTTEGLYLARSRFRCGPPGAPEVLARQRLEIGNAGSDSGPSAAQAVLGKVPRNVDMKAGGGFLGRLGQLMSRAAAAQEVPGALFEGMRVGSILSRRDLGFFRQIS